MRESMQSIIAKLPPNLCSLRLLYVRKDWVDEYCLNTNDFSSCEAASLKFLDNRLADPASWSLRLADRSAASRLADYQPCPHKPDVSSLLTRPHTQQHSLPFPTSHLPHHLKPSRLLPSQHVEILLIDGARRAPVSILLLDPAVTAGVGREGLAGDRDGAVF